MAQSAWAFDARDLNPREKLGIGGVPDRAPALLHDEYSGMGNSLS